MFEHFAPDTRTVVVHAQEDARRLGHGFIGREHLLLALVSIEHPASAVLREHGVTPWRVEEEIVRQTGLGAGSRLFGTLNRDAPASIGIDLDAVRARIEESFGPEALTRADRAVSPPTRPSRLNPRRAVPPGLVPPWRRRRRQERAVRTAPAPAPTRLHQATGARPTGHIPFTRRVKESLENAVREAQSLRTDQIGVEHLALGLLAMNSGPALSVLSALGAPAPALRAAIVDRYRQAS